MLLFLACAAPGESLVVTPSSGSATGYGEVEVSGVEGTITRLWIDEIEAFNLSSEGGATVATWQGAPSTGPVTLSLEVDGAVVDYPQALEVEGPVDPVFGRVVGLGASFTMGVQNGVPSDHGALASPGMLLARSAGAFYALPLLVPGLFPEIGLADIGPAPGCAIPDIVEFVSDASVDVITTLADENGFAFAPGRVTPDVAPRNLAVGGTQVEVLAHGTDAFELNFVAHLVYDPYGGLGDAPPYSQLELAVAAEPTLVLSFDLLGNDLIWSVVTERYLDPSKATPVSELQGPLAEVLAALANTGAEVFVANMPDPTVLGAARQKQALMVAEGAYTEAEAEAVAAEIRALANDYNALLGATAAPYPNVHVVDVASVVADVATTGRDLAGEQVGITLLGGFSSFDGLHFSNTGYALLAETFVTAINGTLGTELAPIDVDAVYAADPMRLSTLRAAGFDPDACE